MICELCGRETDKLYKVIIEGAELMVCERCKKYGIPVRNPQKERRIIPTVYVKESHAEDLELVDNWCDILRNALKGKNLKDIAAKVGISETRLRKYLSGDVEPPEEDVRKLEKYLGVKLLRKVESEEYRRDRGEEVRVTIGDIVEIRVKS